MMRAGSVNPVSPMKKLRWGILSTARIATQKVIPAMQRSARGTVVAIASRTPARAQAAANDLGIPHAYGSYEALLDAPAVDAVYNPLPNLMHVALSIQALQAGKHVLCEKPIGVSAPDAEMLANAAAAHPHLTVAEAFMYRHHPQWVCARDLVRAGHIGALRTIHAFFAYTNKDPDNIRNKAHLGGGALMDIGCYGVSLARWLFGKEPRRVMATMRRDPVFGTDILTTGLLDFGHGMASFTVATQLHRYQHVDILGEAGHIRIHIPFNAPPDKPVTIRITGRGGVEIRHFGPVDQYALQADAFAEAVAHNTRMPSTVDDALRNMHVIDALFDSVRRDAWITVAGREQGTLK